jgi:hypothetical protein
MEAAFLAADCGDIRFVLRDCFCVGRSRLRAEPVNA